MKHLTVVQHTQSEFLGLLEDHFEGRQIRFGYHRPFTSDGELPHPDIVGDGLVLLGGGPWGTATDGHIIPTLDEEITLARTCLMLQKPIIGIGLGAQILAIAADGSAEQSPLVFTTTDMIRTDPEALNGYLPETAPNIVYMRDRPVPPTYARILAVDEAGAPALFQIGENAFGFTGHPGVKPAMIEDLIMEFIEAPDDPGPGLEALRAGKTRVEDALVPIMTGLVQLTKLMQN